MAHTDISKEKKHKPTGRKNAPRDKSGKFDRKILASTGPEPVNTGETITIPLEGIKKPKRIKFNKETPTGGGHLDIPIELVQEFGLLTNEDLDLKNDPVKLPSQELDLIDSMEFLNGENKLTIRFSKKHNRMFRIQVFLNDKHEVRPVTYTGSSTGYAFWNLLKGALK